VDILPVKREQFAEWLSMRQALYTGLDDEFHRREMEAIFASAEIMCFLGVSRVGEGLMAMMELSLRNVVDGCIGSPVGYIEGLYLKPEFRGRGFGRRMIAFAESWFISSGCREMATDTELENTTAQQFFRYAGFEETWRIIEFKKTIL
jgi:aminoglycoside 6'-N-acetyltransferase I